MQENGHKNSYNANFNRLKRIPETVKADAIFQEVQKLH